jgi:hypothetical protein
VSQPFEVFEYHIDKLSEILAEKSGGSLKDINKKLHRHYFENYFDGIGARTIIVENDYIDRDFLDDYAEYYVKCFKRYRRKCTRLHFFRTSLSSEDLDALLSSGPDDFLESKFQEAYLGFIVVKPLPQTVIGRTCLTAYPSDGGRRNFPILRPYKANLFGLSLQIDSLAFQEQDMVVAACATSALWSVFHGTGMLFQHPIPSPVKITKAATDNFPIEDRAIPSHGLNYAQMANVIRSVGLEAIIVDVSKHYILKSTLYAYLKGSIPLIMGINLYDVTGKKVGFMGKHAVAITGYNLGLSEAEPFPNTGFLLRASRIDKIYVHDDQVGPFARMKFDGKKVVLDQGKEASTISTSWRGDNGKGAVGSARAVAECVLIPIYHKLRITFETIHDSVLFFDLFFEQLREKGFLPSLAQRLEWEIYLTTINELKKDLFNSKALNGSYRKNTLTENMPRFIWRATAHNQDSPVLDLLFDATDIEQGNFFLRAIEHDLLIAMILRIVAKEEAVVKNFEESPANRILEWFKEQPIESFS